MRKQIIVNKNTIEFEGVNSDIQDTLISFNCGLLQGLYNFDYIIQVLRERENMPNKFSIARKLNRKNNDK